MKKLFSIIFLAVVCLLPACAPDCAKVTGPDDIPYVSIITPGCASDPLHETTGDFLINSASDFDAYCSGGTAPAEWDFTNKTYIIIQYCTGMPEPYLAGVGNEPSDINKIVVTIGNPCADGPVIAIAIFKVFCLEIDKTAKILTVVKKDEER